MVLPLSARMLGDLPRYAALLKSHSRPRTELDYLLEADSGTSLVKSPRPIWLYAYFEANELCESILGCVKLCVEEDLLEEVADLRAHDGTARELEGWLDRRQSQLNTLIDGIVQGHGTLSKSKRELAELPSEEQMALIEATTPTPLRRLPGAPRRLSARQACSAHPNHTRWAVRAWIPGDGSGWSVQRARLGMAPGPAPTRGTTIGKARAVPRRAPARHYRARSAGASHAREDAACPA